LVAVSVRPVTPQLQKEIEFGTGLKVHLEHLGSADVMTAIHQAYWGDSAVLRTSTRESLRRIEQSEPVALRDPERLPDGGDVGQLLHGIIAHAWAIGASDLHFSPLHDGCRVQARLKGELLHSNESLCSRASYLRLVQRLKVMAALDITCSHRPQDGAIQLRLQDRAQDIRLSLLPTIHGEKAVLRFYAAEVLSLKQIGVPDELVARLERFCGLSEGLAVTAGPTGSGKTTTLYALASQLSRDSQSVVTIEDPVEQKIPGLHQVQLSAQQGLGAEPVLRAVLRQDPDAIVVGEIRDAAVAKIALEAALTGHLVMTSVHAGNVLGVLRRLQLFGLDPFSLCHALKIVLCQQLLPKLCEKCRVLDLSGSEQLGISIKKAVGCSACDYSGYTGRALVIEALELSNTGKDRILRSWRDALELPAPSELGRHFASADITRDLLSGGVIDLKYAKPIVAGFT
jgi:general secretion pathway protein E